MWTGDTQLRERATAVLATVLEELVKASPSPTTVSSEQHV